MAPRASKRVGIEISNSAVRIAEVTFSGGRAKLVNLGQVRLPPRAVVDGAITDVPAVMSAIQRCMSEGNFSAKEVHLGIAGLRAITRELDMPHVPDSELDAAVRLQALDVIPFPVEKTVMSARPLEELTGPDGTAIRRVLLGGSPPGFVDPLLEAVRPPASTPMSVDLTSTALIRALYDPAAGLGGPEAIVAIGAGLTTVIVHEAGVPHFVRTIAEGGDTITAAIAGALDLPIDDAEATKRNLDQSGPHIRAAATAANEAATSLIAEIRSSIEYYSTLPGRVEIRRVTLTGGGSRSLRPARAPPAEPSCAGRPRQRRSPGSRPTSRPTRSPTATRSAPSSSGSPCRSPRASSRSTSCRRRSSRHASGHGPIVCSSPWRR